MLTSEPADVAVASKIVSGVARRTGIDVSVVPEASARAIPRIAVSSLSHSVSLPPER